jgi:hypothetical protein
MGECNGLSEIVPEPLTEYISLLSSKPAQERGLLFGHQYTVKAPDESTMPRNYDERMAAVTEFRVEYDNLMEKWYGEKGAWIGVTVGEMIQNMAVHASDNDNEKVHGHILINQYDVGPYIFVGLLSTYQKKATLEELTKFFQAWVSRDDICANLDNPRGRGLKCLGDIAQEAKVSNDLKDFWMTFDLRRVHL